MPSINAKLLSMCSPRTRLFRTNWSEACSSDKTSENALLIHPQWLIVHKKFPLWDKGERGLIPSAVSHGWIKKCACTLVQAFIIWSVYKIKMTCMKPGYLYHCISYPTLQKWNIEVYRTTRAEQKGHCHTDENGQGASLSTITMLNNSTVILTFFKEDPQQL